MYEGGTLAHSRILLLESRDSRSGTVKGLEIIQSLVKDGVDFTKFYASVYEQEVSGGGWLPMHRDLTNIDQVIPEEDDVRFPFLSSSSSSISSKSNEEGDEEVVPVPCRIDVKLFHRPAVGFPERSHDSMMAMASAQTTGTLPKSTGYFGIGLVSPKTETNVGTVWRSAYQLGAAYLFTIGQRYKSQSTDTVNTPSRIPLFELEDWTTFAKVAPRGCPLVAVEMGGTPLEEFDHPKNAIYILGSEDNGVPNSIVRACHHVISLDSERYASYNVAVAGSLVMYDRMTKMNAKKKENERNQK